MRQDEGWAWVVAGSSFTLMFLAWGICDAFGVLLVDLLEAFDAGEAATSVVGSLQIFLMYVLGIFAEPILDKFGWRAVSIFGSVLIATGFVLSAMSPNIYVLYVTYGVMIGVGTSAIYYPCLTIVQLYFKRYRGLMIGLTIAGGGVGEAVIPSFLRAVLNGCGWRWTLVVMGALSLTGILCGLAYRPPVFRDIEEVSDSHDLLQSDTNSNNNKQLQTENKKLVDCTLCRSLVFILFLINAGLYLMSYIIPLTYMPLKATKQDGLDPTQGAFLVSIIGIAGVVCRLPAGWLGDKGLYLGLYCYVMGAFIAGLASLMMPLWTDYSSLIMYSIVYGASAGVIETLYYSNLTNMFGVDLVVKATGQMEFLGSFTLLVATPLSGWIIEETRDLDAPFMLAGAALMTSACVVAGIALLQKYKDGQIQCCSSSSEFEELH